MLLLVRLATLAGLLVSGLRSEFSDRDCAVTVGMSPFRE